MTTEYDLTIDGEEPIAEPGRRRIYSNTGIELAARLLEQRADLPFADSSPRRSSSRSASPAASTARRPTAIAGGSATSWPSAASFSSRLSSRPRPSARRRPSSSPVSTAFCPASAGWSRTTGAWPGSLRNANHPRWTGSRNSERTFGHFGASGTFLWVDPDAGVACGVLTDRRFGDWAKEAWPGFSDAVLAEVAGRSCDKRLSGLPPNPPGVVGEEWPQELVERRPVAAGDHCGSHRGHGRRSRHAHRRRDLAEVVAGPEHAARAEIALADGQDSGEEDVEPVVGLALAYEDRARSDLLALHALPEPGERLARQSGEQLDPGELVLCGGPARRGYSSSIRPVCVSSCSSSVGRGFSCTLIPPEIA